MINYHKNKLIDECVSKYCATFAGMLDTADYVPEKYNVKILRYIFKNMRRQFRKIDREDKIYQRKLLKKLRRQLMAKVTHKKCDSDVTDPPETSAENHTKV